MANKRFKFHSKASLQPKNRLKPSKLDPIRNEFRSLVVHANELISRLKTAGALWKSQSYIKFFGENPDGKFDIDNKKRFREIRREINRVNEFLASEDSDVAGAETVDRVLRAVGEHGISFQNQNIINGNERFSDKDQEKIKFAMKIYREIAETEYLAIGKQKGQFGSDNLINLIYDEIEGYDPNMPEQDINEMHARVKNIGYEVINKFKRDTLMGFLSGSPNSDNDVNIVEQLRDSTTADEFYKKNPWLRGDNF